MAERVVFDTNAMISALLWKGKSYHCLLLARSKIIQSMYCDPMLAELTEKLREKFKYSENQIQAIVADIRKYAEKVEISGELKVVRADSDDDKFIECAIAAMQNSSSQATIICWALANTEVSKFFLLMSLFHGLYKIASSRPNDEPRLVVFIQNQKQENVNFHVWYFWVRYQQRRSARSRPHRSREAADLPRLRLGRCGDTKQRHN